MAINKIIFLIIIVSSKTEINSRSLAIIYNSQWFFIQLVDNFFAASFFVSVILKTQERVCNSSKYTHEMNKNKQTLVIM